MIYCLFDKIFAGLNTAKRFHKVVNKSTVRKFIAALHQIVASSAPDERIMLVEIPFLKQ